MVMAFLASGSSSGSLPELKKLGIDEIALVKGQGNYLAVLVDVENSKLLEIVKSRRQEYLREVLLSWDPEVLNGTACSGNRCNAFVINWGYTRFRPDSLMSRYSLDFLRKVVTAYELGFGSIRQLADQFMICHATVHSYIFRHRETQDITPKKHGPNRPGKLEPHRDFIVQMVQMVKDYPDWTVRQDREHLLEKQEIYVSVGGMCEFLKKEGLTLKKQLIGRKKW